MFDRIKEAFRVLVSSPKRERHEASYDSSKTSPENRRHWSNATDRPAVWENTPLVRTKLRSRGRYEADNNSYCAGMVSTLATDTIGYVPPKLQVLTDDVELNKYIETKWEEWSSHILVNLPEKLRILDEGRRIEGENFLAMVPDREIQDETGIQLGILNLGAARIADPTYNANLIQGDTYNDDGVLVNVRTARATAFKMVPGHDELQYGGAVFAADLKTVSARYMLQWFNPRRAGQFRGLCEYQQALPLFAQLRRYDLATLMAAETAALLAGIMKTNMPTVEPAKVADWTKTELERGTLLALPEGWDATQFKPEQPISVYEMFVNCILRQIGRVLDIPFGVMAGDSSKYNYSSARLDYTGYDERLKFDRQQLCVRILSPLFYEWFLELTLTDNKVKRFYGTKIKHTWQFTKRPSIDPVKDAKASTESIGNKTSNLAIECAKDGRNWQEVLEQRAAEVKKMKELGLDNPSEVEIDGVSVKA